MKELSESIEEQMNDPDFRHAYAESFMNSSIAAQIKMIREQREFTQATLAEMIGTKQAGISRLENVNYEGWKVSTLNRIARAFDVRLRISFEEFSDLTTEIRKFGRKSLERRSYSGSITAAAVLENKETESPPLSDGEQQALRGRNVDTPLLDQILEGSNNASIVDTPSQGFGVRGISGAESGRDSLPAKPSDPFIREVQVRQVSKYPIGA